MTNFNDLVSLLIIGPFVWYFTFMVVNFIPKIFHFIDYEGVKINFKND